MPVTAETREALFSFVKEKLFCPDTHLLYDFILKGENYFPTPEEVRASFPNPCGWGSGMEDSMIAGGVAVGACADLLAAGHLSPTEVAAVSSFGHRVAAGMLSCAEHGGRDGFLPRSLCPTDKTCFYPESSRDQYTLFFYGAFRAERAGFLTEEEKTAFSRVLTRMAERAARRMTEENGYDLLTYDGRRSLNLIMWGKDLAPHEYNRLPALYALTYRFTRQEKWKAAYLALREEAYARSFPLAPVWHDYALQQMQAAFAVLLGCEEDAAWRARYAAAMKKVARFAVEDIPRARAELAETQPWHPVFLPFREEKMYPHKRFTHGAFFDVERESDSYFRIMDGAHIPLICAMAGEGGDAVRDLYDAALGKIDLPTHESNLPLYFLAAACAAERAAQG